MVTSQHVVPTTLRQQHFLLQVSAPITLLQEHLLETDCSGEVKNISAGPPYS